MRIFRLKAAMPAWLVSLLLASSIQIAHAVPGFVMLPADGFDSSAYTICNSSGEFGLEDAVAPSVTVQSACSINTPKLLETQMNAPVEGFQMVGMLVRDIPMPAPYAGPDDIVATLTDTVWRNEAKTECIYGTHVQMKIAPLADGQSWEVNDVTRGGFAGLPVEAAYFHKSPSEPKSISPAVIFRVGRTFTSVRHAKGDVDLPALTGGPSPDKAVTSVQAAAASANWVTFTTDLNANDSDGNSRPLSPMMYIKTSCSAETPLEKDGAIRLRTTGQKGQRQLEITVPALVPVGANLDMY